MSVTIIITIVTVLVSVVALLNKEYFHKLEYNPYMVKHSNQYYRMFSHALIHADWFHLFVNMYVLYHFGKVTESFFAYVHEGRGTFYFILLYLGGVMFSALPAYKKQQDNFHYNAVGASGAVSSVLFASILFMPLEKIYLFFIPIGIPAFIFAILYIAFEAYMDKRSGDNIAHDAHLWGAIFGIVFTIIIKPAVGLRFIEQVMGFLF